MSKETFRILLPCIVDQPDPKAKEPGKTMRVSLRPGETIQRDPNEAKMKALVYFGQAEQITGVKPQPRPQTPRPDLAQKPEQAPKAKA